MRMVLFSVILLLTTVAASGARVPEGTLYQRPDGSYAYTVSADDVVGQWQVAFGNADLWVELVRSNPQLADPDLIYPGVELNVPPRLVKLFKIIAETDRTTADDGYPWGWLHNKQVAPDTVTVTETKTRVPEWLYFVLLGLVVLAFALWYRWRDWRSRASQYQQVAHQLRDRSDRREKQEAVRDYRDPYSGPPIRENGLPTVESAVAFFTKMYREEREGLTVAESNQLPPLVTITRIRAVDVKGPMNILFATGWEDRNPNTWFPCWQAFLSDGSFRLTAWRCANDVRAHGGAESLPETQIRPREDVPEYLPEQPVVIWGSTETTSVNLEPEAEAAESSESSVPLFCRVVVSDPRRYVLHPAGGGQEVIIALGPLQGINLGIEGDEIFQTTKGDRTVIGRIAIDSSNLT